MALHSELWVPLSKETKKKAKKPYEPHIGEQETIYNSTSNTFFFRNIHLDFLMLSVFINNNKVFEREVEKWCDEMPA